MLRLVKALSVIALPVIIEHQGQSISSFYRHVTVERNPQMNETTVLSAHLCRSYDATRNSCSSNNGLTISSPIRL
jgi:hypothetical protein